jgi:hypothetical protein
VTMLSWIVLFDRELPKYWEVPQFGSAGDGCSSAAELLTMVLCDRFERAVSELAVGVVAEGEVDAVVLDTDGIRVLWLIVTPGVEIGRGIMTFVDGWLPAEADGTLVFGIGTPNLT